MEASFFRLRQLRLCLRELLVELLQNFIVLT